jgi:hypothetical protein
MASQMLASVKDMSAWTTPNEASASTTEASCGCHSRPGPAPGRRSAVSCTWACGTGSIALPIGARSLPLFAVRRADIEIFARELEARGRARATVTRRLCTIAGFCRYAVEEELLEHSPAARTSAGRGWITSPMRPPWIATSSERSWSPPGSGRPPSTR